jgi:hypothetical protein
VVYSVFGSGSGNSRQGGVNKSTDGGATWRPVGFQLEGGFELNPETCLPYGFRHLALDPTDDDVVFAAQEIPTAGAGKLYRTTNGVHQGAGGVALGPRPGGLYHLFGPLQV